jgi:hypothetical protein
MTRASCLCGDVAWEADAPLELMHHCHCSRCRKAHGAAFATFGGVPAEAFRLRGQERVVRWLSAPGFFRCFCGRCGSVVPGDAVEGKVYVPAGNFEGDPGSRPLAHIFAASKAPWFEIRDELPAFDAYPPGFDLPVLPDREAPASAGKVGGSCLCGAVAYVLDGEPLFCRNCHCSRCRKARSAAHASNLIAAADAVRFTRGEDLLETFQLRGARSFAQTFCRTCGSPMPRIARDRNIAVVPMGSLDGDPGMAPDCHIFVASKAPWYAIPGDLPQHAEYPPGN